MPPLLTRSTSVLSCPPGGLFDFPGCAPGEAVLETRVYLILTAPYPSRSTVRWGSCGGAFFVDMGGVFPAPIWILDINTFLP